MSGSRRNGSALTARFSGFGTRAVFRSGFATLVTAQGTEAIGCFPWGVLFRAKWQATMQRLKAKPNTTT